MPVLNVAVLGHRPSKIFIITTTGRLDRLGARIFLWLSVHTWGRWTRWLPQNVVTVISMLYFAAGIAQEVIVHQYGGWGGALNGAVLVGVSAYMQINAHRLRHLSGPMTAIQVRDILVARSMATTRAFAVPIALFFLAVSAWHFVLSNIVSDVGLLMWIWGLYTLTMGRTLPHKSAKRRWRMPSLPKLRLPKPIPVPS